MLQATQWQSPAFPQQAPAPFTPFAPATAPPAPGFDIGGMLAQLMPIIMMVMMMSLVMPMMKGLVPER